MSKTQLWYKATMAASSPYTILGWKIALILLGTIGLLTGLIRKPGFWSSYVLDMVGPAWNNILLRGLYTSKKSTFLSMRFSPEAAVLLLFGIGVVIETSQYFKIFDATFDPYDYFVYGFLLLPCYFLDKYLLTRLNEVEKA